jgi:hypothetical protein
MINGEVNDLARIVGLKSRAIEIISKKTQAGFGKDPPASGTWHPN